MFSKKIKAVFAVGDQLHTFRKTTLSSYHFWDERPGLSDEPELPIPEPANIEFDFGALFREVAIGGNGIVSPSWSRSPS
jgi:hypothetical protein